MRRFTTIAGALLVLAGCADSDNSIAGPGASPLPTARNVTSETSSDLWASIITGETGPGSLYQLYMPRAVEWLDGVLRPRHPRCARAGLASRPGRVPGAPRAARRPRLCHRVFELLGKRVRGRGCSPPYAPAARAVRVALRAAGTQLPPRAFARGPRHHAAGRAVPRTSMTASFRSAASRAGRGRSSNTS